MDAVMRWPVDRERIRQSLENLKKFWPNQGSKLENILRGLEQNPRPPYSRLAPLSRRISSLQGTQTLHPFLWRLAKILTIITRPVVETRESRQIAFDSYTLKYDIIEGPGYRYVEAWSVELSVPGVDENDPRFQAIDGE